MARCLGFGDEETFGPRPALALAFVYAFSVRTHDERLCNLQLLPFGSPVPDGAAAESVRLTLLYV